MTEPTQKINGTTELENMVSLLESLAGVDQPSLPEDVGDRADAALQRIKTCLLRPIDDPRWVAALPPFVQQYQARLTGFADRLFFLDETGAKAGRVADLVSGVLTGVMGLIGLLKTCYPEQFSLSYFLPQSQAKGFAIKFQEQWEKLKGLDLPLLNDSLATGPLEQQLLQLTRPKNRISLTYQLCRYLDQLLEALAERRSTNDTAILSALVRCTIRSNFNPVGWTSYCQEWIQQWLRDVDDPQQRWERVQFLLKELRQIPLESQVACPDLPSLYEQLVHWLQAEAYFLEQMAGPVPQPKMNPVMKTEPETLVTSSLSVDQLGLLFRAGKELDLIKTRSLKALFDRITPFLSTTTKARLSADSMRTKSYSPEKRDIEQVKDILMQLFKRISSY